ncbi:MAG: chorismate mutase [Candidatus Pacebacteria bacterium]|nr:chorismate mutase [Candidatus Paceibacterota bacterium]
MKRKIDIQNLRQKINNFDMKIIELISKRQSLMPLVGLYKKENKVPIHQPQREKEILAKIKILADEHKLNPVMLEKIFKTLFKDAKERQRKI